MSRTPTPGTLEYISIGPAPFVPIKGLGRTIQVLLAIHIVLALAAIVACGMDVQLLRGARLHPITDEQAIASDIRSAWLGRASQLMVLATGTVFLIWVHRATRNLRRFSQEPLKYSPRAAVANFLIPVLNLVRIPKTLIYIWHRSQPQPEVSSRAAIVWWWWATWLIAFVIGRISIVIGLRDESLDGSLLSTWLAIVTLGLWGVAALLAIRMVGRIGWMQENKPPAGEAFAVPAVVETPRKPGMSKKMKLLILFGVMVFFSSGYKETGGEPMLNLFLSLVMTGCMVAFIVVACSREAASPRR